MVKCVVLCVMIKLVPTHFRQNGDYDNMTTVKTTKKEKTAFMTRCALLAALICIMSPISFAIGPVPISLGLFAVMLCGVVSDVKSSVVSVIVFVLLGACGLPVFSAAHGGAAVIAGPTGGYIWSYILSAAVISFICRAGEKRSIIKSFAACIVGTAVCYTFGTIQFLAVTGKYTLIDALAKCVFPFIAVDIVKSVVAVIIGENVSRRLPKNR